MCNKDVSTYPFTMGFVLEYYKFQEICDKVVSTGFLYFILFPIDIRLKKCVTELFLKILLC